MHRVRAIYLAVVMLLCMLPVAQAAEPRIALVIGNGAYASSPLINPPNDATLIAETLKSLGFDVIVRRDSNQVTMKRAIQEFGARLEKAGPTAVGLFFYAGHGVQLNGRNYLIPTAANIQREADVEIEAVSADWVLEQMRYARNNLNLVILDACRNNPFARSMRSADRGLAKMDAPAGTLIAYSTAPGDVAADGDGRNSPYSLSLAQAMRDVRQPVEQVFKRARVAVMSATANRQTPWESSSLTGDFYFATTGAPAATPAPAPAAAPVAVTSPPPVATTTVAPTRKPAVERPTATATEPADACSRPVGRWVVAGVEGEVAIQSDKTLEWWRASGDRLPAITGSWVCQSAQSRRFVLHWNNGDVNTLTLSSDGRNLTGTNVVGLPVFVTRVR